MSLLSFGFSILAARFLGVESYGVYKLAITVCTLLVAICFLGLDGGVVRYIPIGLKERDDAKVWGVIQLGTAVPGLVGLLVAAVFFFGAEFLANRIFEDPSLAPVLQIMVLAIPIRVVTTALGAICAGFKQVQCGTYADDIGFNLIKLLLAVALLVLGFGIIGLAIGYVLAAIGSVSIAFAFANRLFPSSRRRDAKRELRTLFAFSVPLYFQRLLNRFGRHVETIFLGYFGVMRDVGIYGAILPLSAVGNMAFDSIRTISAPIISELHNAGLLDELERFYQATSKWALTINLPIFATIVLFAETLLSIFGSEFTAGETGLIILAAGAMFNVSTGVCGTVINMTGYSRLGLLNSIIYLVTTVGFAVVLIPRFHLVGAAVAGTITIVINNTLRLFQVFFLFDGLLPFGKPTLKPIVAILVAGSLTAYLQHNWWVDQPIAQLLVMGPILCLAYGLLLAVMRLSQDDRVILKKIATRLGF